MVDALGQKVVYLEVDLQRLGRHLSVGQCLLLLAILNYQEDFPSFLAVVHRSLAVV